MSLSLKENKQPVAKLVEAKEGFIFGDISTIDEISHRYH